jgi:hypothetical protein
MVLRGRRRTGGCGVFARHRGNDREEISRPLGAGPVEDDSEATARVALTDWHASTHRTSVLLRRAQGKHAPKRVAMPLAPAPGVESWARRTER